MADNDSQANARPAKRRKTQPEPSQRTTRSKARKQSTPWKSDADDSHTNPLSSPPSPLPSLPSRAHPPTYHAPLLLTTRASRAALLQWFTTVSSHRAMPWRQPFTPPASLPRPALARRAYEVWISEVMLQQTRVAAAAAYWRRWMRTWPRLRDLAAADEADVLAAWAGLGYYARAGRVWRAARAVCDEHDAAAAGDGGGDRGDDPVLPGDVRALMRLPGVGRYTAGAVAAIVFGVPAAMVDGNVLRVLSRQMGVLGDVKGDRAVVELVWEAAEELVRAVAADGEDEVSERPGQWGQALMELGSTVCTPTPKCAECPITATCRAYQEGLALASGRNGVGFGDIEDVCTLCAPFVETLGGAPDETPDAAAIAVSKGGRLSHFFAPPTKAQPQEAGAPAPQTLQTIISHARKFPLRKPKKKLREEEALVCAVRCSSDGRYLIHRRPEKGLLAGLWELPSCVLPESTDSTAETRTTRAMAYARDLVAARNPKRGRAVKLQLQHLGELGSVPWLFSHLKLTMHVHLFEWDGAAPTSLSEQRWAFTEDIERESMGTGMKKCWALVKDAQSNEAKGN